MYEYRAMTDEQRQAAVNERQKRGFPLHRPPHLESPDDVRIVTGTCFEHACILNSAERLSWFETGLLEMLVELEIPCHAWCVLPNHYHVLVQIPDIKAFGVAIGRLHGRTSFEMNRADDTKGRKVWCNYEDRCMRSEGHYWTSINYIHNNPVKHDYVKKWTEWPFSSVHGYLQEKGRDWLLDLWRNHPVLDFGKEWDD